MTVTMPDTIGDFRLVREIGRGGMGVVYEATQISLGRRVALKILPGIAASEPATLERFHREAAAAAQLNHQGIVQVFEAGEADGLHFIAMELVVGRSLADVIRETRGARADASPRPSEVTWNVASGDEATFHVDAADLAESSTRLSRPIDTEVALRWNPGLRRAVSLVAQACRAVQVAHDRGILHRDLKPQNLLVTDDDRVKVVDFGLARCRDGAQLTQTGDVMGTPSYMSPEQFQGQSTQLDARTDVYALGATLFETLTGSPPFRADNIQALVQQILHREAPKIRSLKVGVPRDLEVICSKALEKDPSLRYATADELADDLERFLRGDPILARPSGVVTRTLKLMRRRPFATASALGILLLAVTAAWLLLRSESERHGSVHRRARALVEEGIVRSILGDSEGAIERYTQALEADEHVLQARVIRGIEHLVRGRTSLGQSDLDRAIQEDSEDVASRSGWAAFVSWGKGTGSLKTFDTLEHEARRDPLTLDALGVLWFLEGRPLEALPFFREARRVEPSRLSSIMGIGGCSFSLGRYDEADTAYEVMATLNPKDGVPRLFRIFIIFKKAQDADGIYKEQLLEHARLMVKEVEQIVGTTTISLLACAAVDSVAPPGQRRRDVQACVAQALDLQATSHPGAAKIPPALVHSIAATVLASATPSVARDEAKKALALGSRLDLPCLVLGRLAASDGHFEEALGWYEKALQFAPESSLTVEALLEHPGPLPDARRVTLANCIAQTLPDDPRVTETAATILEKAGHMDPANATRRHAIKRYRVDGRIEDARRLQKHLDSR